MNPQHILFDLDDTLIHCNKYFFNVINQFTVLMLEWFQNCPITEKEIRAKQGELDIAMVQAEGFSSSHFPASLVLTYRYFIERTGLKLNPRHEDLLSKLGYTAFEQQFEAYPDMKDTLERLSEHHILYLYTGGEKEIQWRKIRQLQLEQYFTDRIFITKHKTTEVMQEIVRNHNLDPTRSWMIGNSIRTDVIPAIESDLNAIHLPVENEWSYNVLELNIEPKRAFYTLNHLREVPPIIHAHATKASPNQR